MEATITRLKVCGQLVDICGMIGAQTTPANASYVVGEIAGAVVACILVFAAVRAAVHRLRRSKLSPEELP
jgi:hypothetical protein